jgi:two-component system, cell cycle sensor histidine kinase and response regulator CckA
MKLQQPKRTIPWFLITVFLFLVVGILVTGFFFYKAQQKHIKTEAQNNLAAIADLKVDQIIRWHNEQMNGAAVIYNDVFFARQVETYFKAPGEANRKQELLSSMRTFQDHFQYESVLLIDAKGTVSLAISAHGDTIGTHAHALVKEAFFQHKVILSDLHSTNFSPSVHMDLVIPLILANRNDRTIAGALLIRIDPNLVLFPLLQKWPTLSRSSETLLLKRLGDEVVYLNELRHQKNTALILRLPISKEQLPAAMAARGIEGIVEGEDYRGVPVLAVIRKIPNTQWWMIAKADQEEIFAPLQMQAWIVGLGVFLLILSTGAIIGFWWRHQRARFYREQYEAQLERQALVKHFNYLIKYANDIIFLFDMDGRIVEANDQACRTYGYTRDEMYRLRIQDIRAPESPSEIENQMKLQEERDGFIFETEHRRKDGTIFPVEISSQFIRIDNSKYLQCIIRNITERKQADKALHASEELYRKLISASPEAIIILEPDGTVSYLSPKAIGLFGYNNEHEVLGHSALEWIHPKDHEKAMNNIANAFRGNYSPNDQYQLRKKDNSEFIGEFNAALLVDGEKKPTGLLVVARDITERKHGEESLIQSLSLLRAALESTADGILIVNSTGKITGSNTQFTKMWNIPEDIISSEDDDRTLNFVLNQLTEPDKFLNKVKDLYRQPELDSFDTIEFKDGRVFERYSHPQLIDGKPVGRVWSFRDVTKRKRAEESLRESEERYRELYTNAPIGIYRTTPSGDILLANPRFLDLLGFSSMDDINIRNLEQTAYEPSYTRSEFKQRMEQEGKVQGLESSWLRRDGSTIFIRENAKAVRGPDGSILYYDGIAEDITDRKHAEEALRESEERHRLLFQSNPQAMWVYDIDTLEFLDVNKAAIKHYGYSRDEFLSMTIKNIRPQEDIPRLLEKISKPTEGLDESGVWRHRKKDGTIIDVEITTHVITFSGRRAKIVRSNDITERKHAEEALKESEERFRRIFEEGPLGMATSGSNFKFIKANAAFCRMMGYEENELTSLSFKDITHPEYIIEDTEAIKKLFAGEFNLYRTEKRYIKKDKRIVWGAATITVVRDNNRQFLYYLAMIEDITERKHAEEALLKSEELFKTLVEFSPVSIAVFSGQNKNIEYVSHRFTELFGYGKDDLPSLGAWWPLAYPMEEYRYQIEAAWRTSIEWSQRENQEPEPIESVITCKDGSTKYIESIFTSMGNLTLVFFSDLTQRRMAEEALRQTHAFNDLLIQTMPFGMNIVDEDGNILFVSKTMKEMLAVDVVDMCCWKVYKDNNQQCQDCPLKRGISFGKPDVIETTDVLGGKTFQISHVGMMYEGRKAMLEVFQDITEQKKLQQELIQSQKMLSIGTLAGGIAHDFNNILAIILGYTTMLHSLKDNPQKFSDGVNAIKQAVDRGAGLVKQILTFASKTDVAFEPTNVPELTRELVSMLQQTFPKTITFNKEIETELPVINTDHSQIHQILLNLCVNARDAMPNGGVITIKAHMAAGDKLLERFPAAHEKRYICITVSDTGTGMDETTRNRIFDPFFTTKEKGKGTGLGLSVVYGVVQTHHGFVDVESEVGNGTTFRLYLPVQKESVAAIETGKAEEQVHGGTETLLVVEDEDLLLDMVTILLEAYGYSVLTAKDGIEAVNVYDQHAQEIALVISDMGLPKLSGDGEFKKLKEINPAVKMILASGYFEPETKATLESAGAIGFLQKPYIIEEVLTKIRKALDGK